MRTRNDEWLNWSSGRRNGKEGRDMGNIYEIKTVGPWNRLNAKVAEKQRYLGESLVSNLDRSGTSH